MPATQPTTTVEQERAAAFVALGFTCTQALLLAATRQGGAAVETGDVQRMLDAGCTHDTALRILL
jgi:hypothetical protein